jgi:hypothetical protein
MIKAVLGFGSASLWDIKVTKEGVERRFAHQIVYRKRKDLSLDVDGRRS